MKGFKKFICSTVLFFLGRGIKAGYAFDSRIKTELDVLGDTSIRLSILPNGPSLMFYKEGKKIVTLHTKKAKQRQADISIDFKNVDGAVLVLLGQVGIAQAYSQNRFTLKGDIFKAMGAVRIMDLVEAYLFPKIMTKHILKRIPKKEVMTLRVYLKVLTGI